MTHAVECRGVSKDYGGQVVGPITISIESGTSVALVGHNGSGKTTLLRLLAGLLEVSGGAARIRGAVAGSLEARSALSFIPDTPVLFDDLSLNEHLEYIAGLHGVADWRPRGRDLVGRFGLADRADDLPIRFSRGMKQKAAIAIGLIWPSEVLLIDEPFVGLDEAGRGVLVELLADERSQGRTILVATHELDFLDRVERCIVMRDGHVAHDGEPDATVVARLLG